MGCAAVALHLRAGMQLARDSARDDVAGIRRASLIAALATVLLVVGCSATGLPNARGLGYQLALRQAAAYLGPLLVLIGPLLVVLHAPALLTLGRVSGHRISVVVIACWLGGALAALTGCAGLCDELRSVLCEQPADGRRRCLVRRLDGSARRRVGRAGRGRGAAVRDQAAATRRLTAGTRGRQGPWTGEVG